jgi:tetratricopeptide (TPR) repeat protein
LFFVNKDLLVTVGGVLALSSVLFGAGLFIAGSALESSSSAQAAVVEPKPETHPHAAEAKKEGDGHGAKADAHGEKKDDTHGAKADDGHGGGHGKDKKKEEAKPAEPEDNSEYLGVLEKKFNDLYARGLYEDARGIALKGSTLDNTSAAWQRRLGDSTFMSEELAGQQRYQRAYEIYSKMIVDDPAPRESEWPRYRAVLALKNLHRWEEASQAAETYIKSYKNSSRAHEVSLIRAQCQFALGERDESRKTIEKLLALEVPADVRAAAMLELAHIEREALPADAGNPSTAKAEVIQIVDTKKKTPVLEDESSGKPKKVELSTLVPSAQWESIRASARVGNFQEAQRLIGPWLDANNPLSSEQRARIALDYAALLKELSNAGN